MRTGPLLKNVLTVFIAAVVLANIMPTFKAQAQQLGVSALGCSSVTSLIEILQQDNGGEIILDRDILIDEYNDPVTVTKPVTINMADHSIEILEEGSFYVDGPAIFQGNKQSGNAFDVTGVLGLGKDAEIYVEGDNSVAVYLRSYGGIDSAFSTIRVRGDNATAIMGENAIGITATRIIAQGAGSTGISGRDDVDVILCHIEADGEAIVSDSKIIVDTSYVRPQVSPATYKSRYYIPERLEQNGVSIPAYDNFTAMERLTDMEETYYWGIISEDEQDDFSGIFLPGKLNGVPQDLSLAGTYDIEFVPDLPDWFPHSALKKTLPITLHIVGENTPHINSIVGFANGALVSFLNPITETSGAVVEYSLDEGLTWKNVKDHGDILFNEYYYYIGDMYAQDYLVRLNVADGPMKGISNIVRFKYYKYPPDHSPSGDRDGTGQGENNQLPPSRETSEKSDSGSSKRDEDIYSPPTKEKNPAGIVESSDDSDVDETYIPAENGASGDSISFSAAQLQDLIEINPQNLTFADDGIRLVVAASVLEQMGIEDSFSVQLKRQDDYRFSIAFTAENLSVDSLNHEEFSLYVPFKTSRGSLPDIRDESGLYDSIQCSGYENGSLHYILTRTGTYIIDGQPEPADIKQNTVLEPIQRDNSTVVMNQEEESPLLRNLFTITAIIFALSIALIIRIKVRKS